MGFNPQFLLATIGCVVLAMTAGTAYQHHQRRLLGGFFDEVLGEIDPRDGNITKGFEKLETDLLKYGGNDMKVFENVAEFKKDNDSDSYGDSFDKLDSRCPVIVSGKNAKASVIDRKCDDDAEVEFRINEGDWRSYLIYLFVDDDEDKDDDDRELVFDTFLDRCTKKDDECCGIEYNLDRGGIYCQHVVINEDRNINDCVRDKRLDFECDDE